LNVDVEALRPLIRSIAAEVAAELQGAGAAVPEKLAISESEAARLLSLQPHQLRDERLRGRIAASKIVGRRIRYERAELLRYLAERRCLGNSESLSA
jgi:hypothetical protein